MREEESPAFPTETTLIRQDDAGTFSASTDEGNHQPQMRQDGDASTADADEDNRPQNRKCTWKSLKKVMVASVLIGFIVFVIFDSLTNQYLRGGIEDFLEWVEDNPAAGVFAFVALYFAATVLLVPGSLLTLGSGFVFANVFGLGLGVLLATVAVFIGASSGAVVSFLLGRYLLREWVQKLTTRYPVFQAIDAALEDKGFRIMALLRLSPIIPFNVLNYISGVTAVSLSDFSWALFAILPGTVLYIFLGASAGSLADSGSSGERTTIQIVTIVLGIVFGVLGIAATSYYAKRELNKIIAKQEEPAEPGNELTEVSLENEEDIA